MANTTDQLSELQGHVAPPTPTSGNRTRIWAADITVVNPDGTVDAQPVTGRATKVAVPVPAGYAPQVGDRVLMTDLLGDAQSPIVITPITRASIPTVTGSRGGNAALASLLSALASENLIIDHSTA